MTPEQHNMLKVSVDQLRGWANDLERIEQEDDKDIIYLVRMKFIDLSLHAEYGIDCFHEIPKD